MNGRAATSLLVMAVGVVAAAAVQEFAPPLGALRVKLPLLAGVAVYYAMRREGAYAAAAAAWCGIAEDGLSGVPAAASLVTLGAAAAFLSRRVKPPMEEGALSCAVCGAALAPLLCAAQYFALRLGGRVAAEQAWFVAARIGAAAPAGFVSALVAAWALRALDWASANVGLEGEGDDGLEAD